MKALLLFPLLLLCSCAVGFRTAMEYGADIVAPATEVVIVNNLRQEVDVTYWQAGELLRQRLPSGQQLVLRGIPGRRIVVKVLDGDEGELEVIGTATYRIRDRRQQIWRITNYRRIR